MRWFLIGAALVLLGPVSGAGETIPRQEENLSVRNEAGIAISQGPGMAAGSIRTRMVRGRSTITPR